MFTILGVWDMYPQKKLFLFEITRFQETIPWFLKWHVRDPVILRGQ